MRMKLNMLQQKLARLATYKYVVVVIAAIVFVGMAYLIGGSNNKNYESIDNGSISEDISFIVNKTSINDTVLNDTSFRQECSKCHNSNITRSGISKERCVRCHDSDHGLPSGEPSRYSDLGKQTVHKEHVGYINNRGCTSCHGIPACNSCHSGHRGISDINTSKNCVTCHGNLPESKGHNEERIILKDGSHKWMSRCNTCHLQNELRFKDIAIYDRVNSSQLCGICHSKQYGDTSHYVKEDGIEKQSCVNCHNPHNPAKARFTIEVFSTTTGEIKDKTSEIIEYLDNNKGFVGLFILLILSIIFEHVFGPKKGQVILTKILKIEHGKSKARAIKVSLSQPFDSAVLNDIAEIINGNDAKIVGVSAGNNEVIVFISRDKKDKDKNIIQNIRSISGVSSAGYSKDYETG